MFSPWSTQTLPVYLKVGGSLHLSAAWAVLRFGLGRGLSVNRAPRARGFCLQRLNAADSQAAGR